MFFITKQQKKYNETIKEIEKEHTAGRLDDYQYGLFKNLKELIIEIKNGG